MGALGIDVLFRGQNLARLLGGLWAALRISLISVAISLPLGLLPGIAMTRENRLVRGILRCYLEFIRIMPQLVLLFLAISGRPGPLAGMCPGKPPPSPFSRSGARRR